MSNERSNHLGLELLADYASGHLEPPDASRVDEHLADCSHCQAELRWLLATAAALAPDTWQTPPLAVRAAARRVFRQTRQPAPAQTATARPSRVIASRGRWQKGWQALFGLDPRRAFRPALLAGLSVLVLFISVYMYRQWQGAGIAEAAVPSLVRGDVQVKLAEAEPWQAVPIPDGVSPSPFYLHAGAELVTGADSSLQITFFEHSQTQVGAATELVVQELERRASHDRVALLQRHGIVAVTVDPAQGQKVDFQIETPSALVQVTGTRFVVMVSADGATEVAVQEGTVAVTGAAILTHVTAGESVVVRPGESPATPIPATRTEQPALASPEAPPASGDTGKATKPAPAATPGPAGRPDEPPGQEIRPTRRPLPEQAPTRMTPPGQAPGNPQDSPPGQQNRATRRPLPTQAAVNPQDSPPGQQNRPAP